MKAQKDIRREAVHSNANFAEAIQSASWGNEPERSAEAISSNQGLDTFRPPSSSDLYALSTEGLTTVQTCGAIDRTLAPAYSGRMALFRAGSNNCENEYT
jgi:hypothetical protein